MPLGLVKRIERLSEALDVGKGGGLADLRGHDAVQFLTGQQLAGAELDLLEHKARAWCAWALGLGGGRAEPGGYRLGRLQLAQALQLFLLALQLGGIGRGGGRWCLVLRQSAGVCRAQSQQDGKSAAEASGVRGNDVGSL